MEKPAAAAAAAVPFFRPEDDAPTKARKTRIFKAFSRQAQDLFHCHFKQIDAFVREVPTGLLALANPCKDPFNPGVFVGGLVSSQ